MWPLIDKRGVDNACGFVIEMKVIRTLMLINHLVDSLPLLHKTDELNSLRKQPTFWDATTGFPLKWRLSNDYWWGATTHLGSASDWSCRERNLLQPFRSTTQIRVVTSHQYGILRSFLRKCRGMSGVPQARTLYLVEVTNSILILTTALGLFVNLFSYFVVWKQPLTNCTYRRYRFGMSSK